MFETMPGIMPNLSPEELMILRRHDLAAFIHSCFLHLNPGITYADNWHICVIAAKLEACRTGRIKQQMAVKEKEQCGVY